MTETATETEPLPLTDRQQWILNLLVENSTLCVPTIRELCRITGISSPNGIACHIAALEKKGYVRRTPGKARAIEVLR